MATVRHRTYEQQAGSTLTAPSPGGPDEHDDPSTTTLSPFAWQERPAATRPGSVRLTRRGRLVVFLVAFVAVLALGIALGTQSVRRRDARHPRADPRRDGRLRRDPVGDRRRRWPRDGDVRAMVDRIEELNALDSAMVQAGQRLRVPVE